MNNSTENENEVTNREAPYLENAYLENRKPRVQSLQLRRKIEDLEDMRRIREESSYDGWGF